MARRSSNTLIFDSLLLEGGLFVPAVLEKAARGEHEGQTASDYHVPKGLSLTDEQGRAFRIASALWKNFDASRGRSDVPALRATHGFALELLRDALGYADIKDCVEAIPIADRGFPITAMAAGGRVPVVVAPHTLDLDEPDEQFVVMGSGARRRSAYQLVQQFLNASQECTWAILTNGRQLRLVRDADTLTRPAFLEADLDLVLRDQRYPDFSAVWRLFHSSRACESNASCVWEAWRHEGQEQGEPVREGLRTGVTEALLALGNGFLQHPGNGALRDHLESGRLTKDAYFQQLLRLIYRCLFVFTVEERGLLHVADDSPSAAVARESYQQGYSFRRFRERALRRVGFDRHSDLWAGMLVVFRGLANGEARLALPALGGLFGTKQCPDLDQARLDNRSLLVAMRQLRWAQISGKLAAIDYRNMGPEELGSVYESLLELVPAIDMSSRLFGFVGITEGGHTYGNARKLSGSYYTPDDLVQELLDNALDPVIDQRLLDHRDDPVKGLLSISVVDPACGSGHFLLAAARRLAERLAELRGTDGAITPGTYRHALREVIAHCIFGVDRNPMALELARTALWLEGYEPGQPLSFLDHHLVCGDALLGLVDFRVLSYGIPANAFKPLTGDQVELCKALLAQNKSALKAFEKRRSDPDFFRSSDSVQLLAERSALEAMQEQTPGQIEEKEAAYERHLSHVRDSRLAQAADLLVAAFLTTKDSTERVSVCPTTQTLADLLFPREGASIPVETIDHARTVCSDARVLHWPIAFAPIFARGGFDCVVGNPPWEVSELSEEEFFAARDSIVASKAGAGRKAAIAQLRTSNIALWTEYQVALRRVEATNTFYRESKRFPLTAIGKLNTYPLFSETISSIVRGKGRAGFIVPTGIATDDSTKEFFAHLVHTKRLASLLSFENEEFVFPSVHHAYRFCLLTISGGDPTEKPEFVFFARQVSYLKDPRRRFTLSTEDFRLINPNTRTCPIFRSQADAELAKKIYRKVPVLVDEVDEDAVLNPWRISFSQGLFNMTSDSALFLKIKSPTCLPLYEGKMVHQFDHRWATYVWSSAKGDYDTEDVSDTSKAQTGFKVQPRYWTELKDVIANSAHMPRFVAQAWREQDGATLLAAFANWITASGDEDLLSGLRSAERRQQVIEAGGQMFRDLPQDESSWYDSRLAGQVDRSLRLDREELHILCCSADIVQGAGRLLDARTPRWFLGWRRNAAANNERTMIASVMPRSGVGDSLFLLTTPHEPRLVAALLACLDSLVVDYVARQKLGGVNFSFFYIKQIPILPPSLYTEADLNYIVPRVLELTYTADDLSDWAKSLGYHGAPFEFQPLRRAQLRAELDSYFAKLYELTRDELRYILSPADTHGPDFPSETFRVLKEREEAECGTFRTKDQVLQAWDQLQQATTAKSLAAQYDTTWMDRPLVMPSAARGNIVADRYRALLVPHLVYQAGGQIDFEKLRRAYWLLTEPKRLQKYAKDTLGKTAKQWATSFRDKLEKDKFIPHLKGAINRDIHLTKKDGSRWVELRRLDNVIDDQHVIFDARLALLVADLWPSEDPIATLSVEEEKILMELEAVT